MLRVRQQAPPFRLPRLGGGWWTFPEEQAQRPALVVFIEADCATCQLTLPYLDKLARHIGVAGTVVAVSQDGERATQEFAKRTGIQLPIVLDHGRKVSAAYDPLTVPTLFVVDAERRVVATQIAFSKKEINELATRLCQLCGVRELVVAGPGDGAPDSMPGCTSRHLEPADAGPSEPPAPIYAKKGRLAERFTVAGGSDLWEHCLQAGWSGPLPAVPPTLDRVNALIALTGLAPDEVIARVPPNYGEATVEKIAANAVMAGCHPALMRVLLPLVRAVCDERFNIHGVQATTHFAAPLVVIHGPVRGELQFASGSNVFSNTARANSTLGRALQLILRNLGGARPGEIDMSTLGNPGKFSYVIAENEEASPWQPFHVEHGLRRDQSALTLFAAEPPRGVSEHNARGARGVLRALSWTLATIWSYRVCGKHEAMVVLSPEHATTISRDGFSKQDARDFLFGNTGVPVRVFDDDGGEGVALRDQYEKIRIQGESCYRKFARPEQIQIVVAGGDAGKFSAVIGSWATGPRGSERVTYEIA